LVNKYVRGQIPVAPPVILATWEAEIRRIAVPRHPGKIVHETLFQKNQLNTGLVEWLK
jgi:hypothetical protein